MKGHYIRDGWYGIKVVVGAGNWSRVALTFSPNPLKPWAGLGGGGGQSSPAPHVARPVCRFITLQRHPWGLPLYTFQRKRPSIRAPPLLQGCKLGLVGPSVH